MNLEMIGIFIVLFLGSMITGIFAGTIMAAAGGLGNVFSGKAGCAGCVIMGIIYLIVSFNFFFPAIFWVIGYARRSILFLLLGIVLVLGGAVIGLLGCYSLFWSIKKGRMRKNPVLLRVYSIAKKKKASAVICCTDGVLILFGYVPGEFLQDSKITTECKSILELDKISWQPTLVGDIVRTHNIQYEKVLFSDWQYDTMDCDDMETFARSLCDEWGGCEVRMHYKQFFYTEPERTYTTNSPYYTINGNLAGGPKTDTIKGQNSSKMLDFKSVVVKKSYIPPTPMSTAAPQSQKKQW